MQRDVRSEEAFMLNKLALKIGLLFFLVIFTVEIILFYILYTNLVNDRVEEVMGDLLARGNTHRDVLEENYTPSTLAHVAIMESESDFIVVITDERSEERRVGRDRGAH